MKRQFLAIAALALLAGGGWLLLRPAPVGDSPSEAATRPALLGPPRPPPAAVLPDGFRTNVVSGRVRQPRARHVALDAHDPDKARIRRMDPAEPAALRPRGFGFAAAPASSSAAVPPTARTRGGDGRAVDSTLVTSFDSVDFDTNAVTTGQLFIPPDAVLAAGPDFVIGVTNTTLVIHDKAGARIAQASLYQFFAALAPQTFTYDPKVIWDQHAGRWFLLTLELTDVALGNPANTSRILFAVSDDADPRGDWSVGEIDSSVVDFNVNLGATVDHFVDFPGLAVDEEAVYVTGNLFAFFSTGGGAPGGVRVWILDKGLGSGGLYDGGAFSAALYDPYAEQGIAATTQPAHVFGQPPAGVGTWLVSYEGLSGGGNEYVQVVRVDDPLGTPLFTQQFVLLGDIEDFATSLPDAPQLGSALRISTNNRRALNAVWRDGSLWLTFTMVDPSSLRAQAWWVRMETAVPGLIESAADQGGVPGDDIAPGTHTFFPCLAVNAKNQMVIGFAASGPAIWPGAYYALRAPSDPPGASGPARALREGVDFYDRPDALDQNRWGDYTGMALDPADECFWAFNQYAMERGTPINGRQGRWATAFGKICAFDCGNGLVEIGEECDDANADNADDCRNDCFLPTCGDGVLDPGLGETCDDGNDVNTDGCLNDCTINDCGPADTDDDGVNDLCDLDDDDDGAADGDDCAPLDPAAFVEPADVAALVVTQSSATVVSWNNLGPGVVYDLASGSLADLLAQEGAVTAVCLANDRPSSIAVDSRAAPPPGHGVWYLVRADNGCVGSYGHATSGAERLPAACP